MRILIVSNLYPPDVMGGYEIACADAARELAARGHQVRVLTSTPRHPVTDSTGANRLLQFVDIYDGYLDSHGDPHTRRLALARATLVNSHNVQLLLAELADFTPDVVSLWNLVGIGGIGLALAVDLSGYPWAWHLQDAGPRDLTVAAGARQAELAGILGRRLRGTWISVSQGLLDEIEAAGAVLEDRVFILPNCVTGERPPARTDWFRPGRTLRCAFSGRLAADKGADLAIDAVALAAASAPRQIELDIYGDGPERAQLEARARSAGAGANIHFRGRIPQRELLQRLSEHDVMIFPTAPREPFGLVTIEAASRGCVPLVTRESAIAQWLTEGREFVGVDRTPASIADALGQIVSGSTSLAAIGAQAEEAVWKNFRLGDVVRHIEDIYQGALQTAAPKPRVPPSEVETLAIVGERLAEAVIGTL